MFVFPGTLPDLTHKLTRDAAERVASNWWKLLLNGALLIVAGVLIFSIDWDVRSLATFIGALFILEGVMMSLTSGIDARVNRGNVISGLLSIAAGIAIIVWPSPGLLAVAIFLGAWLIVVGTLTISGAFAARNLIPNWWLLLITRPARGPPRRARARRPRRDASRAGYGRRDLGRRSRRLPNRLVIRAQAPTARRRPGIRTDGQRFDLCVRPPRARGSRRRPLLITEPGPKDRTSASGGRSIH